MHDCINMNANNLCDICRNYVQTMKSDVNTNTDTNTDTETPSVVWLMYNLTCNWRKCLILEHMHSYTECLSVVESLYNSISQYEATTADPDPDPNPISIVSTYMYISLSVSPSDVYNPLYFCLSDV